MLRAAGRQLWRSSRRARCRRSAISPTRWRMSPPARSVSRIEMAAPFIVLGTGVLRRRSASSRAWCRSFRCCSSRSRCRSSADSLLFALVLATGMRWFLDGVRAAIRASSPGLSAWPTNPMTGQKTEDPSQRKLQRARDEGQVAQSREINTWFMLAASAASVLFVAPAMARTHRARACRLRRSAALHRRRRHASGRRSRPRSGAVAAALVAAARHPDARPRSPARVVQIGFVFATEQARLRCSRISRRCAGFKRLFSLRVASSSSLKSMAKIVVVGAVAGWMLRGEIDALAHMAALTPRATARRDRAV